MSILTISLQYRCDIATITLLFIIYMSYVCVDIDNIASILMRYRYYNIAIHYLYALCVCRYRRYRFNIDAILLQQRCYSLSIYPKYVSISIDDIASISMQYRYYNVTIHYLYVLCMCRYRRYRFNIDAISIL